MDLAIVVTVVIVALAFDYTNGFHDAANAIATIVGTRVLSPFVAVMMAGVFNFVGAISGTAVATTVGKLPHPESQHRLLPRHSSQPSPSEQASAGLPRPSSFERGMRLTPAARLSRFR